MNEDLRHILRHPDFDLNAVRKDFPYLDEPHPVIYLDNAATTQRPRQVLERLGAFYGHENANPLRGNHRLSLSATEAYEKARIAVAKRIHADSTSEIIFTRNATESLNLVAYLFALYVLKPGDEVLITRLEHHSNAVNWQFACRQSGATLKYVELGEDFQLDMADFDAKLTDRTKVVAFSAASNVIATLPPVKEMVRKARARGAVTVVDGAQYVPHEAVDVQDLDCDFFAFSGHKMCAPFGIGVLYGKRAWLEKLPPFLYGGEMIEYVNDADSTYAELPYKYEAGTMNVGGAVGLHAAIDYLDGIGMDAIAAYEKALATYLAEGLDAKGGIDLYRPRQHEAGTMVAFNIHGAHPHDVSTIMDASDVAIRSGHHCTQPLHRGLCIGSSCRASVAFYNTVEEVDAFLDAVDTVREVMGLSPDTPAEEV
ncbi:MAG: SufS family cysteine desulfurase [Peptoniphilaceae bacterium]|nr:SufS family cysteine desulfurase [Peptoniphilaceae bacterium]MDY6086086.1 SufS family cysteine desulfurase [Peptoniphilaceae bacterium]